MFANSKRDSTASTSSNSSAILKDQAAVALGGLDPRFECPICLSCLREPILTTCGHRFCRECIYEWVQKKDWRCPIDNRTLKKEDLRPDKGVLAEIMEPFLNCPYIDRGCKSLLSPWELESHVSTCPHESMSNTNSLDGCQWCGAAVRTDDIQKHLDEECDKVPCSCRFREVGCRATVPRADLPAHLDSQIHDHLNLVSAAYNKLSVLVKEQSKDLIDFKSQEASKKWEAPPKAGAAASSVAHAQLEDSSSELMKNLYEKVVALEQKSREQEIKIENLEEKVFTMKRDIHLHSGHYVWELRDFGKNLKAMQASLPGLKIIYSTPFYTMPFGYRFCIRQNLNPAGTALSLHVHLVKGDYDNSLDWPFKGRITLVAVNQRGGENMCEVMNIESELAAFQKPTRDINPRGFGFADFVSLPELFNNGFLKDDTVILRIHIERD